MAKGLVRSLSRGAPQRSIVQKQTIRVVNLPVTVSGLTGIGFGTAIAGDLPQGNILFLGAISYLTLNTASANVTTTFTGAYSVGSAPTADSTLSGAEVDLVPQTTLTAATGRVSPRTRGANATQLMLDNTDKTLEININVLIDDASVSADGNACFLNGEISLVYSVILDD